LDHQKNGNNNNSKGNGGKKGKNLKNKGLNYSFYNIKDSYKEEDY
jgi:hypothetical protein